MGLYQKMNDTLSKNEVKDYEEIIKEINYFYTKYKSESEIEYRTSINEIIEKCLNEGYDSLKKYFFSVPSLFFDESTSIENLINSSADNKRKIEKRIGLLLDKNIGLIKKKGTVKYGESFVQKFVQIENKYKNSNLNDAQLNIKYLNELLIEYPDLVDTTKMASNFFAIAAGFSPEYHKLFSLIKTDVDQQLKLGKSVEEAISLSLVKKGLNIDFKDIIDSLSNVVNKQVESESKLKSILLQKLPPVFMKSFFANKTQRLRETVQDRLQNGEQLETILKEILPEAYGLVKAACEITLGIKPYDVQLMGAISMNEGKIAEMYTGEGKTLTAILPAYLNALSGGEVDIFTPNDYLADRDARKNKKIFEFLGLTVGCVKANGQTKEEKKKAYKCDIVYGSSTAFAFDFLDDTNAENVDQMVQRTEKPAFVIIDEADQILINNALSPYCLSSNGKPLSRIEKQENDESHANLIKAYAIVQKLSSNKYIANNRSRFDNIIDPYTEEEKEIFNNHSIIVYQEKMSTNSQVILTDRGIEELFYYGMQEEIDNLTQLSRDFFENNEDYIVNRDYIIENNNLVLTIEGLIKASHETDEFFELRLKWLSDEKCGVLQKYVSNALTAQYLMENGRNYQVGVDQKTGKRIIQVLQDGRIMHDSHFKDGIHEAIGLKEGIDITPAPGERFIDRGLAEISNRALIYRYSKISGMTGTADESAFYDIYGLDTFKVPRNKQYQYSKQPKIYPKPKFREDRPIKLYKTKKEKIKGIVDEVIESHKKGQPILVVVDSAEEAESFYKIISTLGLKPNLLIADKNLEEENAIIAEAGKFGAITIATEMAGRGTDIKLGGEVETDREKIREKLLKDEALNRLLSILTLTISKENSQNILEERKKQILSNPNIYLEPEIKKLRQKYENDTGYKKKIDKKIDDEIEKIVSPITNAGGLNYIQMNPFKTTRNDNQGKGRVGRQGEPGTTRIYVSLMDLANLGVDTREISTIQHTMKNKVFVDDDELDGKISEIIETAQSVNEYNMDLAIAQTDTMDLAISSIGMLLFKNKKEIIKSDTVDIFIENMIETSVEEILKDTVKPSKLKKINKDNYRLSRLKLNMNGLINEYESMFGISITEEEIFRQCSDVGDLKDLLEDKAKEKLKTVYKDMEPEQIVSTQKSILIDGINKTYIEFMESMEDIQRQIINDKIAQNNSKNRSLEIRGIYRECRKEGWFSCMQSIFKVDTKKREYQSPVEVSSHLEELRNESNNRIKIFNVEPLSQEISLRETLPIEAEPLSRKK